MGKVILSGIVPPLTAPKTGIAAGDLAVGSVVKLMENGTAAEYLVVNQGKPSGSSLYDDSCNGTWLLREDIYENRQWHSSDSNSYKASTIHSYLNSTFLGLFNSATQAQIKTVKIPYVNGAGSSAVASGANGLSAQIFLLGGYEVGIGGASFVPVDGAKLDYFNANTGTDSKRIAYLNGTAALWWLRSPYTDNTSRAWGVYSGGDCGVSICSRSNGVRPALVLSPEALFDETTMILKGSA